MRHITLSTSGLVEQINRLAERKLQITLSVSLHAPDDETRSALMPVNRKYNIETLLKACEDYFAVTGRRVSFEYALIDGVNDSNEKADLLAAKIGGMSCHVNIITLNDVKESPLKPSRRLHEFVSRLEQNGINVTIRRKLGSDIDAACGQLRRKHLQNIQPERG